MTKIPRDLSAPALCQALKKCGYEVTRQSGSHLRLTTTVKGEHHVTIPNHGALRVGTLSAILAEIATHFAISRQDLQQKLFA